MSANLIPSFDAFTLSAVCAELQAAFVAARVQKIQQPSENEIILSAYGRRGAQRLLLCADPKAFRVHLTQRKREHPVAPPQFCGVCRKYLDGAIVAAVTMPRFDRVLRITFRAHDGEAVSLIAELMGRNANVILISGAESIRGVLRSSPADSPRLLRVGGNYVIPPGYDERTDPLDALTSGAFDALPENADAARDALLTQYAGIGKFGAEEILARAALRNVTPAEALRQLMQDVREERFAPHSVSDANGATVGVWAFRPECIPADRRHPREEMSVALDTFYATALDRNAGSDARNALQRTLRAEIKFRKKELSSADATLREAERAERYEQIGNNLLAALWKIERGAADVSAPDLYSDDGAEILIVLDPKKSPHENAESYFTRARKSRDAAAYATHRKAEVSEQLDTLKTLALEADSADADALPELQTRLVAVVGANRANVAPTSDARRTKTAVSPFAGFRIRTFTIGEYTLLVGESAEANDHLTTRVASPSDLWLHVRSAPGAHGVLRAGGKPDRVPESAIRRAAEIVAARSSAVKHSGIVAVDVIEKRHVRKPRGAKPGLVTYTNERTVEVTPTL